MVKKKESLKKPNKIHSKEASKSFTSNLEKIQQQFGKNPDLTIREFNLGDTNIQAAIVFINGLVDQSSIHERILKPLMLEISFSDRWKRGVARNDLSQFIQDHILTISKTKEVSIEDVFSNVLTGTTALFIEGISGVIILENRSPKTRNIEEPTVEALVRGPKIGFLESLQENISILRTTCPDSNLRLDSYRVGDRIKKDLVIAYISDIASEELITEVKQRIEKISIDVVLESGYIEELIEDNWLSPFPQTQVTERPDRVVASMLEGRVVILVDGTPFALIVPTTFGMMLQSPEDYYERWIPGTFVRILRILAAAVSLFLPAIYISFVFFHHGLIPTKLAISIAGTRQGVPFPSFIESLIMEVSIELLREAGLRLPKPVGQTVGLVGGLVVGQAAVEAGLISPFMVIVVAFTAIASFAIPQYQAGIAIRILRFGAMLSATFLGLFGVVMFFLLLVTHMIRLQSFGMSYASSSSPNNFRDLKDYILRAPWVFMKKRPGIFHSKDKVRKR